MIFTTVTLNASFGSASLAILYHSMACLGYIIFLRKGYFKILVGASSTAANMFLVAEAILQLLIRVMRRQEISTGDRKISSRRGI